MASGKKSFLLYCDIISTVEKLDNETAGELFKHILGYVNDTDPVVPNMIVDLVFEPIKQALKRDLIKFEKIRERNSNNGAMGGRPSKSVQSEETQKNPNNPVGLLGIGTNPMEPKKADSVIGIVIDSDIVIDSESEIESKKEIVQEKPQKRFSKPSIFEIQSYCLERKNTVDTQRFYDYYESNGWRIGKNPMKDWKAAVRNWEKSSINNQTSIKNGQQSISTGEGKDYSAGKEKYMRK